MVGNDFSSPRSRPSSRFAESTDFSASCCNCAQSGGSYCMVPPNRSSVQSRPSAAVCWLLRFCDALPQNRHWPKQCLLVGCKSGMRTLKTLVRCRRCTKCLVLPGMPGPSGDVGPSGFASGPVLCQCHALERAFRKENIENRARLLIQRFGIRACSKVAVNLGGHGIYRQ